MAKLNFGVTPTSVILRVKLFNSSVTTGAGLTGLTFESAGLIIGTLKKGDAATTAYTQAAGTIETITTLGTYQTPTADKCRFKEVDATNHPGLYEIHLANTRFASTESVIVSISGATNLAQCDIELQTVNLASDVVANTAGLALEAGGNLASALADTNELQGLIADSKLPSQVKGWDDINLTTKMKADVNAEADTANVDYGANKIAPNTVVPDAAGTAAALHATTDGKIDTIDTIIDTLKALLIIKEATVVDASPSQTVFETSLVEATANYWNNGAIQWKVGTANAGVIRSVKDYVVANGELTLNTALPVTPVNGDGFYIIAARAFKLAGLEASEIEAAALAAVTDYDPPTRAEATTDKEAIITQVDANETKIDVIDGIVDNILLDTAEIGTAGAGLTNINLPNQTMDIVGDITGNLSGSVGSVTGHTAQTGDLYGLMTSADTELSAIPSTAGTIINKIKFLFQYFRNKKTVTGATETLFKEDASTALGTSALSDDGNTITKGETN